jgi:hypothetical protein
VKYQSALVKSRDFQAIIVLDWKAVLQMQYLSEPDTGYMGCQHFPSCQQENKSKQYAT